MSDDMRIDWKSLRERLETALSSSPERERTEDLERLERRTRLLAARLEPAVEREDDLDLVVFRLGNETYAIESHYVLEIVRLSDLTAVPGAPEYVRGVMNRRGEVLLIVDLRGLLGIATANREPSEGGNVIVCGADAVELGLLVDEADELRLLPGDGVRDGATLRAPTSSELIRGVTADAMLVVDAAALLRDPRLFIQQKQGES
ncbi:MAG: chemotaxis protein CheW [Acidobacteria bacterium]|nr:chemotaxis protein CheW [Acidobacteriota bacterium]